MNDLICKQGLRMLKKLRFNGRTDGVYQKDDVYPDDTLFDIRERIYYKKIEIIPEIIEHIINIEDLMIYETGTLVGGRVHSQMSIDEEKKLPTIKEYCKKINISDI